MNVNPLLLPTLLFAVVLFWGGKRVWASRATSSLRLLLVILAVCLSIPGLLMAFYYLHLFDNAAWFYQFRACPWSELSAAGMGVLAGILSSLAGGTRRVQIPMLVLLLLVLAAPHMKPLIAPLSATAMKDRWHGDVCVQSTPSTCGPASAATLLRKYGIHLSEKEIARQCFTYSGGTENWYLARLFRRHGFNVQFVTSLPSTSPIPAPSIAGVKVSEYGHFVAVLSATNDTIVTGDPLVGTETNSVELARKRFHFTGFFLKLEK